MRKTKIICTLGPASRDEETLRELMKSGMDVARLNFSHGSHAYHRETIETFRKVRDELKLPVGLMLDTGGPEIRLCAFRGHRAVLRAGETFVLTTQEREGDETGASITYRNLPAQLRPGNRILLDDGRISLTVEQTSETEIRCRVEDGGEISDCKGVNVPKVHLDMPYLSAKDEADILFGIEQDVDFIAASFVRCRKDVVLLRKFLNYHGGHAIKIISKIENGEGVENFDEILEESDGIMVARGDMGVEIEYERLPGLQKMFIRRCYEAGKMVITATQMLESMIHSNTPTRAEITDVANAVFDGTSAIMLSGETAVGDHPVQVVRVMAKIARQAEHDAFDMNVYQNILYTTDQTDMTNAICDAACTTARDVGASAIIAVTKSGFTAQRVSKFRPRVAIIAATPEQKTFYQLSLSWGVYPVLALNQRDTDSLFQHAVDCAKNLDMVSAGDRVVITAGMPLNTQGSTNQLRVQVVN